MLFKFSFFAFGSLFVGAVALSQAQEIHVWDLALTEQPGQLTVYNPDRDDAQFGTPVRSGDLDGDGYDDLVISAMAGDVPVDVALRYSHSYNDNILTFVNNINTIEGGTHLSGFRSALTRAMNNHASKNNLIKAKKNEKITLTGEDFREGLTAILTHKVAYSSWSIPK